MNGGHTQIALSSIWTIKKSRLMRARSQAPALIGQTGQLWMGIKYGNYREYCEKKQDEMDRTDITEINP